MAEGLGLRVLDDCRYADHHTYAKSDIERVRARARELKADLIITTEKDAGKLTPFLTETDEDWWVVRLGTEFTVGEDRLRQLIMRESISMKAGACA
jgi:tetraacyldisaccharide 4'-kinase